MTTWKPAPNLARRVAMVHAVYPTMVVGEIGDQTHAAEAGGSDHNPDSRGVVHAIDLMTETDTANSGAAAHLLAWLLADTTDLQYVIHDRRIYGRDEANGWHGSPYTGSDPHTNHIHVSGKHGSVGRNAATGTGYDLAAEAYTPPVTLLEFMEATMTTLTDADGAALIWRVHAIDNMLAVIAGGPEKGQPVPFVVAFKALQTQAATLTATVAKIPTTTLPAGPMSDADVARIAKATADLLDQRLAS